MRGDVEQHYHYIGDLHDVAEAYHSHQELESLTDGLREDLGRAEARISDLENRLYDLEQLMSDVTR